MLANTQRQPETMSHSDLLTYVKELEAQREEALIPHVNVLREKVKLLEAALDWALTHGVKSVDFGITGFWDQSGYDGSEILAPPHLAPVLEASRKRIAGDAAYDSVKAKMERINGSDKV